MFRVEFFHSTDDDDGRDRLKNVVQSNRGTDAPNRKRSKSRITVKRVVAHLQLTRRHSTNAGDPGSRSLPVFCQAKTGSLNPCQAPKPHQNSPKYSFQTTTARTPLCQDARPEQSATAIQSSTTSSPRIAKPNPQQILLFCRLDRTLSKAEGGSGETCSSRGLAPKQMAGARIPTL
jgi:hypothetical protein